MLAYLEEYNLNDVRLLEKGTIKNKISFYLKIPNLIFELFIRIFFYL
jgi:hypothetical protein